MKRPRGDSMVNPARRPRKSDARLIAVAGPFRVFSQANGQFTITATWASAVPAACRVSPENYCFDCACYHIGGVMTRTAIAEAVQAWLNAQG